MTRYDDRITRVINYIYDNPTGDLSLDTLADVAAMSRFHWHRVFRAMTGETCVAAVKRIRMHHASVALVQTDAPVAAIGASVGYPDVTSFSRAFAQVFGKPPGEFRMEGRLATHVIKTSTGEPGKMDVTIKTVPARHLVVMPHTGPYQEIGQAFQTLYARIGGLGMFHRIREGVAIFYDDPMEKPPADLRSDGGVTLAEGMSVPDGMAGKTIPEGKAATVLYKGPYSGLPAVYDDLYSAWPPSSEEETADHPSYEVYLNDPTNTPPDELLTEIVMPLR